MKCRAIKLAALWLMATSVCADDSGQNGVKAVGGTLLNTAAPMDPSAGLIKVVFGLAFVVAAIFATAWFYRRYGNFNKASGNGLRIVGGLAVGNRERVVLLQVGEEQVLVGVTPNHIETLLVLKHPLTPDASPGKQGVDHTFAHRLADALRQRTSGR